MRRVFLRLSLPPLFFLPLIIAAVIYFSLTTTNPEAAERQTIAHLPVILLGVQFSLLLLLIKILRTDKLKGADIAWRITPGQTPASETLLGIGIGAALAALYLIALSPLIELAQTRIGDYVPPGEIMPALGGMILPFFIANIVLAPFVEESLYRGYAINALRRRYSPATAALISCLFFGLLHWAGGFWYILATGLIAGGVFSLLFLWRKNIAAAFRAHLTLNTVEFIYILSR